ncbi:PqqD family peptide modification chaperone [Intestinibacter sp.]|uniref:PqqD family peptide modification chaperone n=1 Tax=Intestinibacter sp. TaxID=1965304 RepID=UPI002A754BC0|nr:PqqD family peptide modification chaperone [Intestinibacter sp.]MDY2735774.1 PqqD family peptide modification chaperone [Intestinibacter sp.]MDY4574157.1 PqqD family peptide modification chaperone [Intestinibacter sp.]
MNNEDALKLVFKISDTIDYQVDDKIVTILEKQDHPIQKFFRKLKFKIPLYKKIKLDEYGSFIFLQIDGKKTVEEIGENLEEEYGENTHPLYERLLMYLNHLHVNCNYIERVN